jgi:nicotinamidase/pyrazinamidase
VVDYESASALVVVDVQNDFADPRGSLYVAGGERVVAAVNREIERAQAAGAMVVYTQDWHPERTPHFERDGGIWPVHCVRDSWGAEFHPELDVVGEVMRKGAEGEDGYSGFTVRDPRGDARSSTRLEALLRAGGVSHVVVVGLATDYCVKETALDAARLGFATVVLRDAIAGVELQPGDSEQALADIRAAGATIE